MTNDSNAHDGRLDALRRSFDATFASPPTNPVAEYSRVLTIRVSTVLHALRIEEIESLLPLRGLSPVPTAHSEVLGIVANRGHLVPVLDLAAILSLPSREAPRHWAVLVRSESHVGLAVDGFERIISVPRTAFAPISDDSHRDSHVFQTVSLGQTLVPVVDVASVLQAIGRRKQNVDTQEE